MQTSTDAPTGATEGGSGTHMEIAGAQRLSAYARALGAESGSVARRAAPERAATSRASGGGVRVTLSGAATKPAATTQAPTVGGASAAAETASTSEAAADTAQVALAREASRSPAPPRTPYASADPARVGARISIRA